MTNIKRYAGKLGIANILSVGLNFISGVILTRILGAEGRGVLAKIEASIGLLAQITTLKSNVGIIYFIANKKIDKKKVTTLAFLILLTSCLLSGGIIILLKKSGLGELVLPANHISSFFILYSLILFFITQAQIIGSAFLRGIKQFQEIYINQILVAVSKLIIYCTVYFILLRGQDHFQLQSGLIMHLSVAVLSLITTSYFLIKNFKIEFDYHLPIKTTIKPFFSFVSISALSLLTNYLNVRLDIWLVEYYEGTEKLGFYAVAVNLCALLTILPKTFRDVLLPYISEGKKETNIEDISFFSKLNTTILISVGGILALISGLIIPILYGREFVASVIPFNILIIGMIFNSIGMVFSTYNYGIGAPKLNFIANLLGLVITIFLGMILIPMHGIKGAAITTTLSYLVSSSVIFYTIVAVHKLPFKNYFFFDGADLKKILNSIRSRIN